MKRTLSYLLIIVGAVFFCSNGNLYAQLDTHNIDITVTLAAWYDLNLDVNTLTFNDAAPTPGPNPTANLSPVEGQVSVSAFAIMFPAAGLTLTCQSGGDLTKGSGSDIGIGAITWTGGGAGFVNGTMATTSQPVGSWASSVFHWHTGTLDFLFSRDYATQEPGVYTATITYTLSAI